MSRLSELMAEFCPNGVEYKSLGELGEFYGGLTGKCKNDFADGNAKFISYMNVYSNSATKLDVDDTVKMGMCERQNAIQYGDVLFTGSSETQDECAISSVVTKEPAEKIYLNSFCFGFRIANRSLFVPDFLKYWLRSAAARQQLIKTASGVTRFNVSKKKMGSVQIPIPPLAVQEEIVRLLDAYTNEVETLTAELEAELAARRKQYEQYRDKLLTFSDEVARKSLGDVCEVLRGMRLTKSQLDDDQGIPVYHGGIVPIGYYDKPNREANMVMVINVGASAGTIGFSSVPFWSSDGCFSLKHDGRLHSKYLYYALKKDEQRIRAKMRVAGIPTLDAMAVKKLSIPIPSIAEQKRIVEILDKFDALCNDETAGLAAEIAARKKQYEYYRDKLLTFKKAS